MPAFIAAALIAGGIATIGVEAALVVSTFWTTFGAAFVLGGVAYAMNRNAQKKLTSQDQGLEQRGEKITVREAIGAHQVIYGRRRVGGTIVYIESTATNQLLHLVIVLAGHECDGIEEVYFNDQLLSINAAGTIVGPAQFANMGSVHMYTGAPGQVADATLVGASAGKWTNAHRLQGRCYLYVILVGNAPAYPSGVPNVSAVVRGKKLFDPRTGTTYWNSNSALCLLDYLISPIGLNLSYAARIDASAAIGAANICDEGVTLTGGGSEPRYLTNGSFDLEAEPQKIIEQLTNAMAGRVVRIGGRWRMHAGAYWIPSETLTTNDFRGSISMQTLLSGREAFNGVRGTFTSPANYWTPDDFPPLQVTSYVTEDQGVETWAEIELPFTTSPSMAQRLAKIHLERSRRQVTLSVPCKLSVMRIQPPETIMITEARYGWSSKVFEVVGFAFAVDKDADGNPYLGVNLSLREMDVGVFNWSSLEQGTYDSGASTNLPNPFSVSPPTGLSINTGDAYALTSADGTIIARIYITWNLHPDAFVRVGGYIEIQFKAVDDTNWHDATTVPGDATSSFISGIASGVAYDIRIRAVNQIGTRSAWTNGSITAAGKSSGPSAPTHLVATPIVEGIRLTWDNPPEPDLSYIEIWSNTTNNRNTATKIAVADGTVYDDTPLVALDVRFYWIRGVNTSRVAGAWSNDVNAGATAAAGFAQLGPGVIDVDAMQEVWLPNLVQNPNFLSGNLDGHEVGQIQSVGLTMGVNFSADWTLTGEGTAWMHDASTGAFQNTPVAYSRTTRTNVGQREGFFQVQPGKRYQAFALIGCHRCKAVVAIAWWDAAGAFISNPVGNEVSSKVGGKLLDDYEQSFVFATAPTNARFASLDVYKYGTTAVQGDSYLFWTREFFSVAGDTQTVPSEWSTTGLLLDGGVVKAGTLSGDRVITNTLHGDKLLANSVSAGKITTPSLQALSAQMGHLTAGNIDLAYGPDGVSEGYLRTSGKWWFDGAAGWVFSRHPTQGTLMEIYANSQVYMRMGAGPWLGPNAGGYGEIRFPNFYVDSLGNALFGGTLTANAINAVDTINIRGQAVTIPIAACRTDLQYPLLPFTAQYDLQTASITSQGGQIFIHASVCLLLPPGIQVNLQLLRNSSQVYIITVNAVGSNAYGFAFGEAPGAGAHTYTLKFWWDDTVGGGGQGSCTAASILLLETRR